jgi:hypothetical protein
MVENFAAIIRPVLEFSLIRKTRRNHGLEHATIHLLSQRIPNLRMSGRSTNSGFFLFGDAPTEMIERAAHDALRRMRAGEHQLAIHPNCGTNYVTAGTLTTLVGMLTLSGASRRRTLDRAPIVMLLMMLAVIFSQPLGMSLQKHITTEGDPGDLEILTVTRRDARMPFSSEPVTMHTVITTQG